MSFPANASLKKNCPYPNCQHDTAWQVSGLICCCEKCFRLSVRCERETCSALNRPFMRYCRRCCADAENTDYGRQSWGACSAEPRDLPSKIAPPQTIHQFPRARTGALLGFAFLKGLLAVHQAGGGVALLHPFRGEDAQSSLVWQDREGFPSPPDIRPFTPFLLANQRHIVFSSQCGISVLSSWSLPDWHFDGTTEYRVLVAADNDTEIVAAPVQLSATQLGYLTRNLHANEYYWYVIDLAAADSGSLSRKSPGIKLALRGFSCQLQALGQEFVAISTPEGHWIWRAADAVAGQVRNLKQTYPTSNPPDDYELKIDSNADFQNPSQLVYLPPKTARQRSTTLRAGRYIEWYFQQQVGRAVALNFYRIDANTLEPLTASVMDRYIPLGRHVDNAQEPVVLAQGSQLKFAALGSDVKMVPGFSPVHDFETAAAIVFSDPLILSIHRYGASNERRLIIRSLAAPGGMLEVEINGLLAEPLNWSNWVFTAEVEGNQVQIRRYDLHS